VATEAAPTPLLSIGDLAARVGVRASALRFYEEERILTPAKREGGKRRYDASAVERVRFVRFCQQLGFSLSDVRRLLTEPTDAAAKRRWRGLVDAKMRELDLAVAKAAAVREVLGHSRDCNCISLEQCTLIADVVSP
jgi:MerR family redox-sensitive transcriptional activator SoxR